MSTLKQVLVHENGQDTERILDWSYIEWLENEAVTGVTNVETQTVSKPTDEKETQTSNPFIMHIDLARTHSKLKHTSLVEADGLLTQFDRQAPARISTSPTLRRMRSTRRPQVDFRDPVRMDSTQEESGTEETPFLLSPLSPVHRHKSPLAACPPPDGENHHDNQANSSAGQGKSRSHRSKTFNNGITCTRQESLSARGVQRFSKDFEFPDDQDKVCHNRLQERRRSSVVVSLPGLDVSPGDLFVSNGVADILNFSDTKKPKWPFSRRGTTKGTTTRTASDIEKYLLKEQIQDWRDTDFQKYKDCSLEEFLRDCDSSQLMSDCDPQDYKRQEAIWELFTSECVYFLDQLMVLKEVFLATLTNLQMRDYLSDVDTWRMFANLNELCLVSFGFLISLLHVIKESWKIPVAGAGPTLLELLHKWCERNQECRRLQLRDLLVAPLQRLTRYPLLLRNVGKRSRTEEEESALQSVVEQVDTSICDLEGKVKWLDNYQKVKLLRDALVWLPVWERDKRAFIPENLKHLLKAVTLENLIAHRCLLHEGKLVLTENAKLHDVYLFLFDDFLLITKIKRNKKKSTGPEQNPLRLPQNQELDQLLKEGCTFTVLDQPISLDRLQLRSVDQLNAAASGLSQSFIIMHQNRYQQCIAAFILQAPSEAVKRVWMSEIEGAVTTLNSQQPPRVKSSSLWVESSQI
uniref:Pleckstrin homology domain containing, family G (with RhoGef domain) member 7 n=1 Tax=Oncorhynchus kisutch TaxID=8019 RepID=A0A8C7CZ05_ONCKI